MARQLRVQYPGAVCQVMNRGDQREPIFPDNQDRERFLATLGETCAKTPWQPPAGRGHQGARPRHMRVREGLIGVRIEA